VEHAEWYGPLLGLESKGSRVDPVGGLAGLARAREEHQGQFFTPLALVEFMWRVAGLFDVAPNRDRWTSQVPRISLFDSSFGSGRMFAFADPAKHRLVGVEIDGELAEKVQIAAERADFDRQLEIGSIEDFRHSQGPHFHVGLLNPPFSITIDSPNVESFDTNAYGRFGRKSSALSHVYAIEQALDRCNHVVAVVPRSLPESILVGERPSLRERLIAIYTIPRSAFVAEGASVDVCVCVWSYEGLRGGATLRQETVRSLDNLAGFKPILDPIQPYNWGTPMLSQVAADTSEPAITIPYLGDPTVRVIHDGRKIGLRFACGLTQGRVLNAIYGDSAHAYRRLDGGRPALGIEWKGQGWFDVQNYVAQEDPLAAFGTFIEIIRAAGGEPVVDPAIPQLIARKARASELAATPFGHVAFVVDNGVDRWLAEQDKVTAVCTVTMRDYTGYGCGYSRVIEPGDRVEFSRSGVFGRKERRSGPRWSGVHSQFHWTVSQTDLLANFTFPDAVELGEGWHTVQPGLVESYPAEVAATRRRALNLGLERWCSWTYQFDDLCEVGTKRRAIIAWEMGLGKARLALALCMLGGGRHNLITVESHLLKEMQIEIGILGIPAADWQVITKPEHVANLRKINLVAYSRLKAPIRKGSKSTYANSLRRRIHTHVCDEGHLLRNEKTAQAQAVLKVSAKVRYLMTGTPIANYPRDILPLIQWVAGDGMAHQVFGRHKPFMRTENLAEISMAPRGIDVFREMFVTTEWITNEFADDLRSGAKREIPVIANVPGFRAMVAPVIKRRVMHEPDVARHITIPEPTITTTTLEWDRRHVALYVKVAREFVDWYKGLYASDRKGVALIAVLAKMQAVQRAANFPAHGVRGQAPFRHVTSKQRHTVARLREWTDQGHKSILLAESPDVIDWLAAELVKHDVDSVIFTGNVPIAKRIEALDSRFRNGPVPVLLATKGCLQTGYNIHQADRVLAYDRTWAPKTEQQAFARVLRPQQRRQVEIELVHLPGSIDEYQAQMVSAKAAAARSGIDYGDEEKPAEGFAHIETILGRFVEDFEQRYGVTAQELAAEIDS
jgi:hypothetical protein